MRRIAGLLIVFLAITIGSTLIITNYTGDPFYETWNRVCQIFFMLVFMAGVVMFGVWLFNGKDV